MTEYKTKSGRILTDEDIQKLADEAERGYDISTLKRRQSAAELVLIKAIDNLESVLAGYFADKDIPIGIRQAVEYLEQAMIQACLSPLKEIKRD